MIACTVHGMKLTANLIFSMQQTAHMWKLIKNHKTFLIYLIINVIHLNLSSPFYELLNIKMDQSFYRHPVYDFVSYKKIDNFKKIVFSFLIQV